MTLMSFCPRCMEKVNIDPDTAPDPLCYICRGSGMVKATPGQKQVYWAKVSRELGVAK